MSRFKSVLNFKNFFNFPKRNFMNISKQKAEMDKSLLINQQEGVKISYYSKIQVCKDGFVFRFLLPESESIVGHKICHYIYLEATLPNGKILRRPFNPISLDTDKGFIDIMIKIYPKDIDNANFGLFSNFLSTLEVSFNE
jgi:cytochrome-b5 reductase